MLRSRLARGGILRSSSFGIARFVHHSSPLQRSLYNTGSRTTIPLSPARRPVPVSSAASHRPLDSHVRVFTASPKHYKSGEDYTPPPRLRSRLYRWIIKSLALTGFAGLTVTGLIVGFFIYDATTYRDPDLHDVPVSQLALTPVFAGKKNLPLAEILIDDIDRPETDAVKDKPKLVILGGGWGAVGLLGDLKPGDYHVTIVSPTNYFLYTPLLPSATVGTLELRSLMQPIRKVLRRLGGHFLRATAVDVDFEEKLVEVQETTPDGEVRSFYLPYDKLVVAVGSQTKTHGVKGLEHAHTLKSILDAREIRRTILNNLERACLPTTSDEERKKLLSFVICGGGATGIEFAAELSDMLNEDLSLQYPKILRNEVSIHVIHSRGHILNTYDETVSQYAENRFARESIKVFFNSRVSEIDKDVVTFTMKDDESGQITKLQLPYGFCLWSTGIGRTPLTETLSKKLGQNNHNALETDTHLRVVGDPTNSVYAIGDCATVQNNLAEHITDFIAQLTAQRGKEPEKLHINFQQWRQVADRVKKQFPQARQHLRRLDKLFHQYDVDKSGTLDFYELKDLLTEIDKRLTSLPATAQRANQQGSYLARKFTALAHADVDPRSPDPDSQVYRAFRYKHLGSMAYVGNAAVFDFGSYGSFGSGIVAMYLWRGVYFAKSVGMRTRALLAIDWMKRGLFGRDLISL